MRGKKLKEGRTMLGFVRKLGEGEGAMESLRIKDQLGRRES